MSSKTALVTHHDHCGSAPPNSFCIVTDSSDGCGARSTPKRSDNQSGVRCLPLSVSPASCNKKQRKRQKDAVLYIVCPDACANKNVSSSSPSQLTWSHALRSKKKNNIIFVTQCSLSLKSSFTLNALSCLSWSTDQAHVQIYG
jgi:hypothetical protein